MIKAFLLFTFLTFLIFLPIFFGKVNLNGNLLVSFYPPYGQNLPYKNSGWDQLRIYFPFYKVTLDSIKHFQLPLWNPYAFSGHPHMADFQSAVFYPLNIAGLFLSQIASWHLLRITPTILGSFFMFLYLRNLTLKRHSELGSESIREQIPKRVRDDKMGGLSSVSSIFGALTFGFSPFILTWGEEVVMSPHSIIWMPLILWGIDRYQETALHPGGLSLMVDRSWGKRLFAAGQNDKKPRFFLAVIWFMIISRLVPWCLLVLVRGKSIQGRLAFWDRTG